MSEMVERVARAIGNVLVNDSHGECLLIATDEQCMEIARAAIEIMRWPTDRMIETGKKDTGDATAAILAWRHMIDEALK